MKSINEMIEIMQAFERGEQIEIFLEMEGKWEENCNPQWDWTHFDYRVKPKTRYVPFETAEEFLVAQREHGYDNGYSVSNGYNDYCAYVSAFNYVILNKRSYDDAVSMSFENLLKKNYKFSDGTPCGKEVQL